MNMKCCSIDVSKRGTLITNRRDHFFKKNINYCILRVLITKFHLADKNFSYPIFLIICQIDGGYFDEFIDSTLRCSMYQCDRCTYVRIYKRSRLKAIKLNEIAASVNCQDGNDGRSNED